MLHTNDWRVQQLGQETLLLRRTHRKRRWIEVEVLPIELPTMPTSLEDAAMHFMRVEYPWPLDISAPLVIGPDAERFHIESFGTTYKHQWFEEMIEPEPQAIGDAGASLAPDDAAVERRPEADLDWLGSNLEQLRFLYAGHWVAIVDGGVRASAENLTDLMQAVEAERMATPLVTFVPDQDVTWRMAYGLQSV